MRIHLLSFARERPREREWLEEAFAASADVSLEADPERADVVLLTDLEFSLSYGRGRDSSRVLRHPTVRRFPERCLVYTEDDVPRAYFPGLYWNLEWYPGARKETAVVPPSAKLRTQPNRALLDAPPPADRAYLFSFIGRASCRYRKDLFAHDFERDDVLIEDSSDYYVHYEPAHASLDAQRNFVEVMRGSKWALCPKGWSVTSYRIIEAMRLGIAPVILSDYWMPVQGPDWDRFALWVPMHDYPRLPEILDAREEEWRERGEVAQAEYRRCFTGDRPAELVVRELFELLGRLKPRTRVGTRVRLAVEHFLHRVGLSSARHLPSRLLNIRAVHRSRKGEPGLAPVATVP